MGVGKSTIGRRLAKKLNKEFIDSDQVIETKTGVDIPTIFEYEGEVGFREREEKSIAELCKLPNIVLATGGGAVLSKNTRQLLSKTGTVFYLQASVETLIKRTQNDVARPLLQSDDKRKTIAELVKQREPLYEEIAEHIVCTDRHTINWAVNQIVTRLESA